MEQDLVTVQRPGEASKLDRAQVGQIAQIQNVIAVDHRFVQLGFAASAADSLSAVPIDRGAIVTALSGHSARLSVETGGVVADQAGQALDELGAAFLPYAGEALHPDVNVKTA